MKWYFAPLLFICVLLVACGTPTPQATPQLVNVYITSAAYSWVKNLYNCAPSSIVVNLSEPQSADMTIRLGEPKHLTTPAFQISTEDVSVIVHPQTRVASLTLGQVRSIFLGQTVNWKEVGGNDLPVQVWSFSSDEDVQDIFNQVVMKGQPITSTARLAVSGDSMVDAIGKNPGSVGVLPHSLMSSEVKSVFTAVKVPVLVITKAAPTGVINELISCLRQGDS